MPRWILVPIDFSPASCVALRASAEVAAGTDATLLLLHVPDGPWQGAGTSEARAAAHERLVAWGAEATARGVAVRPVVAEPQEPAEAILRASAEADLIVAAPRSGDGPGLGRTAAAVVEAARCPVLFVTPDAGVGLRVRVAVDLSERSAEALRTARRLVAARGGTVDAVHVVPDEVQAALWGGEPVEAGDDLPAERQLRRLTRFVEAAGGPAVPVAIHAAEGTRAAAVDRASAPGGVPPLPPAAGPFSKAASPS